MVRVRIVSLLPSATELVAALGLAEALVGRSHECDYPPGVEALPVCTYPKFDPQGSSGEIHARVEQLLQSALSVYGLELATLAALQPTHILTQAQCEVCAVSLADVQAAVRTHLPSRPQVISLQPNTLEDLWQDIRHTAQTLGVDPEPLVSHLQARVQRVQAQVSQRPRPTVVCIEWTDPLMNAGHWVPELVHLAGGQELLGQWGQASAWISWEDLLTANPERLIFMPCGFSLPQTRQAVLELSRDPHWQQLQAVQNHQIYLVDGNHYFNRPGPRLVDSLEILAEILHGIPSGYRSAWQRLQQPSYAECR
ncbi:MAG: cobalamin-binding protein [Thermostichales cyanobacterium BF4_bins_65]